MANDPNTLIRKLDDLLEIERAALLDGDLEKLGGIVEEKEALIDELNRAEFDDAEPLVPMNEKIMRNQALLEQALSGIRSVAKKLSEMRQARKSFDTYNHLGHRNRIEPDAESSVEKRA